MEFSDGVILFRAVESTDLEVLRNWINDPETSCYLRASWPVSSREQQDWFEQLKKDATRKKLMLDLLGVGPIGVLSLTEIDPVNRSVEIGITIGVAEYRRKGLASRALRYAVATLFDTFGYHRVWAQILETNEDSLHLFEHAGFRKEGCLRESVYWKGRMVGRWIVARLRTDSLPGGRR
jgi:diamine N-acetyltransferase